MVRPPVEQKTGGSINITVTATEIGAAVTGISSATPQQRTSPLGFKCPW